MSDSDGVQLLGDDLSRLREAVRMRNQAGAVPRTDTAKLLADNPTLMRLRELEVLEKIASAGLLNAVLGERNHQWAASTQKRLLRLPQGNHNTIMG